MSRSTEVNWPTSTAIAAGPKIAAQAHQRQAASGREAMTGPWGRLRLDVVADEIIVRAKAGGEVAAVGLSSQGVR